MHCAILRYDKSLIHRAVGGFWWRVVGFRFLLALTLVATCLVLSFRAGDTSWVVGVLGSVLVVGICYLVALYLVHYRNAVHTLRAMGSPQATLEASATSLSLSSGAGTASIPWSAVTEVWQLKTCWLLLLSRSQFMTLPLADLPPELLAFVRARVEASGGKIA